MSIAHELSSDVAAAVLAPEEGAAPVDASERAELVLEVHSTLRRLSAEQQRRNRTLKGEAENPQSGESEAAVQS